MTTTSRPPRHPFEVGHRVEATTVIHAAASRGRGRRMARATWVVGDKGTVIAARTFRWIGVRPGEPTHGHEVTVRMDEGGEVIAMADTFRRAFPTLADYEAKWAAERAAK